MADPGLLWVAHWTPDWLHPMDSDVFLMGGEHMSKEKKYFETETFRLELDAFAELFLPEIQRFYESEEGQRYFAEWKENQKAAGTHE